MKQQWAIVQAAAAAMALVGLSSTARAQYEVPDPAYAAPASYYSTATGMGATLKANLNAIIDGHTSSSYDQAKDRLPVLDDDPANAANVLLVYSGYSVQGPWSLNGTIWNREHLWCDSYGIDGTSPAYGELFNLRPCDPGVNSDRGNEYYNDIPIAVRQVGNTDAPETWEDTSNTMWEPRPIEKGDLARAAFYMDTRYEGDGTDGFANNLTLVDDVALITSANSNFGKLSALLKWHYQDGVSNYERRRNNIIYTDYQHNRNPFVDHPEYVWSLFGAPLQGDNSSKIYVGPTAPTDGTSSTTVNVRAMKNGTLPTAGVVLTKNGVTPTTYDINVSGSGTTSSAGVGQAFDYNTQSRTLTVGLSASTATTGLKTGSITIDNTDLTSLGTGQGSADGNDTITVNGQVVDNRVISAASTYSGRVITGRSVSLPVNLATTGDDDHFTRVTVKAAGASADANGVAIAAAGGDSLFNSASSTASRALGATFSGTGARSGSRSFTVQGEGLTGEAVNPVSVSYSVTAVSGSEGSFDSSTNLDASSIDFDYVPVGFVRTANFSIHNLDATPGLTAALDVDSVSPSGDSAVLTNNIVATTTPIAAGSGNNYTATVNSAIAGTYAATHTIAVSDENIPGAASGANLVLNTTARVTAGSFPVTGTMNLFSGETFTAASASIVSNVTVTQSGAGTFHITGAQSHEADSQLTIAGGTVVMDTDAGSVLSAPLGISVLNSGSNISFNSDQHLRQLTLNSATSGTLEANGNRTLYVNGLSVTDAKLDLNDNDLVVTYGTGPSAFSDVQSAVVGGYRSSPDPLATGIISTTSQNAGGATILALFDNALLGASEWPAGSGNTIDANAVVGKYTYFGDLSLDGQVTGDDYSVIDANLGSMPLAGLGWVSGDANLDGVVTGDDYGVIDASLGLGMGNPLTSSSLAVPEPMGLAMCVAGGLLMMRRRRSGRRHSD